MKTIGLLGGMSWESTQTYYRAINETVKRRLGGLHSAEIVLYSVDFDPIEKLQQAGDWTKAGNVLCRVAQRIEAAGADFLMICTNTMHKVADQVAAAIKIPLLHIADATGEAIEKAGIRRVGLLGTAFTMEQDFYKGRLKEKYGLEVVVPDESDRRKVHDIIFRELCLGDIRPQSKQVYIDIIDRLAQKDAEAVILGCTEIGLLIKQAETPVPLYDTTSIHAEKAVEVALSAAR